MVTFHQELAITQPFLTFRKAQFMDLALKKQALRMLTYGLYVVMCNDGGEVNAFTANWLTQVSFDPPLLAVSVENNTKSLPMILRSRQFTVNVLHAGQRDLAGKLGKSALKSPDKMQGIQYSIEPEGFPILSVALSWIACEVRQVTPAGDSTLLVAEVVNAGVLAEGEPLTMAAAGFRHAG
ncbi:MAG TPA: flavin reductase family protein [Ktedonosporobacter sp.]|nr:flavin reductase family protein [Ktedonosporobacter sp.]